MRSARAKDKHSQCLPAVIRAPKEKPIHAVVRINGSSLNPHRVIAPGGEVIVARRKESYGSRLIHMPGWMGLLCAVSHLRNVLNGRLLLNVG